MAVDWEQKLKQHCQHNYHIIRSNEHSTTNEKDSPWGTKKQPSFGKYTPKISKSTTPENQLEITVHKKLKQKVHYNFINDAVEPTKDVRMYVHFEQPF